MKRTLLVSVAAIALAIGANSAYAQGSRQGPSGGAAGGAGNPSATAPAGSESTSGGASGSMSSEPKQKGAREQTAPRDSTTQREEKGSREPGKQQTQGTTGSGTTKSGAAERKNGASDSKSGTAERKGGTETKSGAAETKSGASAGSSVSLSTEQKTQIRQSVLTSSAPRVSSVNFDVHVGVVVPHSVHIVEVPATLVTIEPRWRGYKYFVYRDEIVIIEPDTLRIVAVLVV
jgi:hypothetical protein